MPASLEKTQYRNSMFAWCVEHFKLIAESYERYLDIVNYSDVQDEPVTSQVEIEQALEDLQDMVDHQIRDYSNIRVEFNQLDYTIKRKP